MVLKMQLKATNNEAALTDLQAEYHFKSIDDYSLIIDRNPDDVDAYFGRALDFMVLQDLSEAIDDYNKVIALNPNFSLAYFNRAVVRYKLTEIESVNDNRSQTTGTNKHPHNYELIMQDYATVIQQNPDFVYAYFNQGNLLGLQKDYKAAISDYNKAIERNPEFAEAFYNRGLTRLSIGETSKGITDLSRAGELGMADAYSIIKKMTAD